MPSTQTQSGLRTPHPVAGHEQPAAHEQLAVVGELQLGSSDGRAAGGDLDLTGRAAGHRTGSLGHPSQLADRQAQILDIQRQSADTFRSLRFELLLPSFHCLALELGLLASHLGVALSEAFFGGAARFDRSSRPALAVLSWTHESSSS